MTSPAQRAFEAWHEKEFGWAINKSQHYGDIRIKGLYECWRAALASRDKLRDAIIVLEEDAEPEVGDILFWPDMDDVRIAMWDTEYSREFKIIRRNNKPVIYRSELV